MKLLEQYKKKYVEWLEGNLDKVLLVGPQSYTGFQLLSEYKNDTHFGRQQAFIMFASLRIADKKKKGLEGLKYSLILIL